MTKMSKSYNDYYYYYYYYDKYYYYYYYNKKKDIKIHIAKEDIFDEF